MAFSLGNLTETLFIAPATRSFTDSIHSDLCFASAKVGFMALSKASRVLGPDTAYLLRYSGDDIFLQLLSTSLLHRSIDTSTEEAGTKGSLVNDPTFIAAFNGSFMLRHDNTKGTNVVVRHLGFATSFVNFITLLFTATLVYCDNVSDV
ncbi:hypothetical protein Tco_1164305 [Tanacetum coccineum]